MAGKRGNPNWQKGMDTPNPRGAPAAGESWKEIYNRLGKLSGQEAAEYCMVLAKDLKRLKGVTLKEGVALRVYVSLLNEPTPGLLTAIMDRGEGKVPDENKHTGDIRVVVVRDAARHNDKPSETP